MGEETERQPGCVQMCDSKLIANQSRSMSGADVANCTQVLPVATDKGRTAANIASKLQNGKVDFMAKLDHRLGFVEVLPGKKLRCKIAEGSLRRDQDLARVLPASSQVEQTEQHAGGVHAQEFVKVACHALVVVDSRDLRPAQNGHVAVSRIGARRNRFGSRE